MLAVRSWPSSMPRVRNCCSPHTSAEAAVQYRGGCPGKRLGGGSGRDRAPASPPHFKQWKRRIYRKAGAFGHRDRPGLFYLCGRRDDHIAAIAIGPTGSIWMAGTADSPNFLGGAVPPYSGGFLARLDFEPLAPATPGIPLVRAVFNAASWQLGDVVSPGQIVTIFGEELAPAAGSATGFPLPQNSRASR